MHETTTWPEDPPTDHGVEGEISSGSRASLRPCAWIVVLSMLVLMRQNEALLSDDVGGAKYKTSDSEGEMSFHVMRSA